MHFELRNHLEVILEQMLPALLQEYEVCPCEKCRLDILALTLNRLTPKYVVTRRGELMAEIDATILQHQADLLSSALMAIRTVRNQPRHDL